MAQLSLQGPDPDVATVLSSAVAALIAVAMLVVRSRSHTKSVHPDG